MCELEEEANKLLTLGNLGKGAPGLICSASNNQGAAFKPSPEEKKVGKGKVPGLYAESPQLSGCNAPQVCST